VIGNNIITYIYIRPEDGKCVHQQACGAIFGQEYEHDDPNWQPPEDWPYKIRDLRKDKPIKEVCFASNTDYESGGSKIP